MKLTLRQARQRLRLTQAQVSKATGVNPVTISQIENGHKPSLRTARLIEAKLGYVLDFPGYHQEQARK